MQQLDPLDARILRAWDADPNATVLSLAQALGVARNTVSARLRRMERAGVLRPPSSRVDPRALGYGLAAFVEVSLSQGRSDEALAALARIAEIVEMHATTGDADLLARVLARDAGDLHRITNAILDVPGVLRTNTAVVLHEALPYRVQPLLERASHRA